MIHRLKPAPALNRAPFTDPAPVTLKACKHRDFFLDSL
jgi:hypothetical protein